jgi:hypothetical protein
MTGDAYDYRWVSLRSNLRGPHHPTKALIALRAVRIAARQCPGRKKPDTKAGLFSARG